MKKIFLSGGSGFIGRHIKEFFTDKYRILAPSSKELNLLDSRAVWRYFHKHQVDFIIHCASYGITRWENDIYNKNILMYKNLKNALPNNAKMISFGSGAQYGRERNLYNVKESDFGLYIPKDEYGLSKYRILNDIYQSENIISLNIFGCFGKYEDKKRFITYCLLSLIKNQSIIINENNTFSYLYVDDLCKILDIFLRIFPKEKSINITPDIANSMEEIVLELCKIKPINYKILKLGRNYCGSNALLHQILIDYQFTPLKDALGKLYNYYKNKIT